MDCILCLQKPKSLKNAIRIFSEKGQQLSIQDIVVQHFWIQPKENEELICDVCWDYVHTFHQFYLRIQEAHNLLAETKPLANLEADPIELKRSERLQSKRALNRNDTPALQKKKRGRPQRGAKADTSSEALKEVPIYMTEVALDADVELDEGRAEDITENKTVILQTTNEIVALESYKPKRKRGRPSKEAQKKSEISLDDNKQTIDLILKSELELADSQDSLGLGNADTDTDYDEATTTQKRTKKDYSMRRNLTLENDKYIAENLKLSCCLCQVPLKDFAELLSHFRSAHQIRGYVLCCAKKLTKRGVLVDHLHMHKDPNYFKCPKCERVMADRRCLELHMQVHDVKGEPGYKCGECSKSFHKRVVYLRHVQCHTPEELKKFRCPRCLKNFATNYLMNLHLKTVHLNTYSKICDVCGKKIIGRGALRRHQELHEGITGPANRCPHCGVTITTKYGLARHIKVMHTDEFQQPQTCPYCSKISPNVVAHKRHISYMHEMQRKHECRLCDKAFKRSKDLQEHMTTHTGDVLYVCTFCPKTFNSNANMYAHRKKAHPKEWELKRLEKYAGNTTNETTAPENEIILTDFQNLKT